MRFKEPFPFLVTKSGGSPGLDKLRYVSARYRYISTMQAKVQFSFADPDGNTYTEANDPSYNATSGLLLVDLVRQSPFGGNLAIETHLAEQGLQTLSPGSLYTGSFGWTTGGSVGTGSGGGTHAGSFGVRVDFWDFAVGSFQASGRGDQDETLGVHTAGPALTVYTDGTALVSAVVVAYGTLVPFGLDVIVPVYFSSFAPAPVGAGWVTGSDPGGSSRVFRPPGIAPLNANNVRIDEAFALNRAAYDPDAVLPGAAPSLTLNMVETGRLSYNGTAPALTAWDWGDL